MICRARSTARTVCAVRLRLLRPFAIALRTSGRDVAELWTAGSRDRPSKVPAQTEANGRRQGHFVTCEDRLGGTNREVLEGVQVR